MKPYAGGELLDASNKIAGVALTPYQCLAYALSRPAVAVTLPGAKSVEELRISAGYCDAPEEEKDYAQALASFPRVSWSGHCMYCSHCEPCPKHIDIASVTKFLNLTIAQSMVPETVREHYKVLEHHAGECIECGACETRCPFGVPIRQNMKKAVQVFGF